MQGYCWVKQWRVGEVLTKALCLATQMSFPKMSFQKTLKLWISDLRESRFSRNLKIFFEISLLDLKSFLFHFHFSILISRHFYFTFISRKEWKGKKFHPFFSKKREWNLTPSFIKKINHSRRVQNPKQCTSEIIFKFSRNFTSRSRSWSFFISLSLLDLNFPSFLFHFHFSISISTHYFFTCTSRKEWMAFFLHFPLLDCPKPTLAGHCFESETFSKEEKI